MVTNESRKIDQEDICLFFRLTDPRGYDFRRGKESAGSTGHTLRHPKRLQKDPLKKKLGTHQSFQEKRMLKTSWN